MKGQKVGGLEATDMKFMNLASHRLGAQPPTGAFSSLSATHATGWKHKTQVSNQEACGCGCQG